MTSQTTPFPVHTIDSAPDASRPSLEALQKGVGFLPNLAASMADAPALIEGFVTLRSILGRSSFTPLERETISLVVSFGNDCSYCMAAHSTFATRQGATEEMLESLRGGRTPHDRRLGALAEYTRQLLANRGHASDGAVRTLMEAGFTRAQALEAILVIAFTTVANYAHNVTKCAVDAAFQAQHWEVPTLR
jgi:uncharacterized peroxidase-related enzyme